MHKNEIYTRLENIIERKRRFNSENFRSEERRQLNAIIKYCLKQLKEEYRNILIKSYFECDYAFWWVDFYCKSSYYRKRIKAVTSFVLLFEIIDEDPDYFTAYRCCL